MKKLLLCLLISYSSLSYAQTSQIVISQLYGAGGNSGATYTHDFVELYNPTTTAVSLAGWSLQYAGHNTNNWNSNFFALSGTIQPGKYFLIQLDGGNNGIALPRPDLSSAAITMSAASGKVALVNNTTLLTGNCPTGAAIVDFVGYGTADCFEGAAAAPAASLTNSITRINNGCTDDNKNSTDFIATTASPRNSTSGGHTCNSGNISITTVSPITFCVDASNRATGNVQYTTTGTFSNSSFNAVLSDVNGSFGAPVVVGTATVTGTNPSGTINITIPAALPSGERYRLQIQASNPSLLSTQSNAVEIINGAKNIFPFFTAASTGQVTLKWTNPAGCFDEVLIVAKESAFDNAVPTGDGSAYNAALNYTAAGSAFDGGKVVYKGTTSNQTVTGLTDGTRYYFKAFSRRGNLWSSGIEISDVPRIVPQPGEIIINQINPGYGTATEEYIELVNTTNKTFSLTDVLIKVASNIGGNAVAGGTLSGTLQPHSYLLVANLKINSVIVGKSSITPDLNIDLGIGASNQQVGLLRKTDSTILDALSYGTITTAVYTEGTPIANPTNRAGLQRKIDGVDNNSTTTDFMFVPVGDIDLRNSTSRLANEGATISGGNYTRLMVTGNSSINGNITVSDKVVLTNGKLSLNNHNLSTSNITGGAPNTYIKTNGSGLLTLTNIGTTAKTFATGNSTYNPLTITNGSNLSWSARVMDDITNNPPFDAAMAVQRTWNITPSGTPAGSATITFEYNDNDATQTGVRFSKSADIQVWQYQTSWTKTGNPVLPEQAGSGKKVTLANVSSYGSFVLVNAASNAPLPIRFINFKARQQGQSNLIEFTNATEKDVAFYQVERSPNGQNFEPVTKLNPKENNNGIVHYNWLDAAPLGGDNYYRIKGVETTGITMYSTIARISSPRVIKQLSVYPNPVLAKQLTWEATLPKGRYSVSVTGSNGQQVYTQTFTYDGGNYNQTLHLPANTASGVYTLQVVNGNFIKQLSFIVQ